MSEPTTSYQARYPGDQYPGNTQRERSQANDRLVALARDYNIHDEEIKALQAFLGLPATPFSPSGPRPGTGDTIIDKLTRVGGTGGCIEDAEICNYAGPLGIDTTARSFINTTAAIDGWINPTAVPSQPGPPPFNPLDPGVPWFGPGGGNPVPPPPGGVPDSGVPPFGGGGDITWFLKNRLILGNYFQWMAQYRLAMQSGETVNFWPRPFSDLFAAVAAIVNLINDWPSGRQEPAVTGRVSIFDVLTPTSVIAQLLLKGFGISVYPGSISGSHIIFNTGVKTLDAGAPGSTTGDIVVVLSSLKSSTYEPSNFTDLQTHPGGVSKLGQGTQPAGTYRIVGSSAFATPSEVLVFTFKGYSKKSLQGDENTWRRETLVGGPTFALTHAPIDGLGASPIIQVYARVVAGAGAWVPLSYVGVPAANANEFDLTGGITTIGTFVPAGYTEIMVLYQRARVT